MSMQVELLEKRQEIIARARADLIGFLAYLDITDMFAIDDEDLLYEVLNNQNVRQHMLGEMSRDDLLSHCHSTAVANAARILAPEDFREMVAECTKIAYGASSECYAVDPNVLASLIYNDAQKHAPTEEISREYCPWWEENDSVFAKNETAKIISGAAQTNVIASPRESASVVPHRQTGRSDSSGGDGDGGDGEPPRPRSPHSPTPPLHHSLNPHQVPPCPVNGMDIKYAIDLPGLAAAIGANARSLRNVFYARPQDFPPAIYLPGTRGPRFMVDDVQAWLEAHKTQPAPPPPATPKSQGRPRKASPAQIASARQHGQGGAT